MSCTTQTARILEELSSAQLQFDPQNSILYRTTVPPSSQKSLGNLLIQAQQLASAASQSALLIGSSNESTDTGDIAIWLGDGEYGDKIHTLKSLGMEAFATQIRPSPSEPAAQLESISTGVLDSPYSFAFTVDSYVISFYLGKLHDGGGWGGLAAVGVWT